MTTEGIPDSMALHFTEWLNILEAKEKDFPLGSGLVVEGGDCISQDCGNVQLLIGWFLPVNQQVCLHSCILTATSKAKNSHLILRHPKPLKLNLSINFQPSDTPSQKRRKSLPFSPGTPASPGIPGEPGCPGLPGRPGLPLEIPSAGRPSRRKATTIISS